MQTTEQWLKEKMDEFNESPKDLLLDQLIKLNCAVGQFLKSPDSKAVKGLLETGYLHIDLLIDEIEKLDP